MGLCGRNNTIHVHIQATLVLILCGMKMISYAQNSSNTTEVLNSSNTTDVLNSSNTTDVLNSSNTTDVLNSSNTTDVLNSSNTTDVLNSSNTTDVLNSSNTTDVLNSSNTTDMLNSSNTTDVLNSSNTTNVLNNPNTTDVQNPYNASDVYLDVINYFNISDVLNSKNISDVSNCFNTSERQNINISNVLNCFNISIMLNKKSIADILNYFNVSDVLNYTNIADVLNSTKFSDGPNTFNMSDDLNNSMSSSSTQFFEPTRKLFKAPLWKTHFVEAVIYCSLTLFIVIVGTLGNLALIITNVLDNNINNIGRIFIINIAIGDLCVASIAEPVCIVGVYYGEEWFDSHWFLCETVAILCFIACIGSYLSFVLRTFNRYIYLCKNAMYYDIYSTKRAIIACVICWIIAAIIDSANLVGWGDHNFDTKSHRCVWDRNASFSYTMTIGAVLLIPFPPTVASFILIFKEIYKRKKSVLSFQEKGDQLQRKSFMESLRASRTLLIGFISFLVLWAPAGVLIMIDFTDTVNLEVYLFTVMLAHFHSCSDFIIDVTIDRKFRRKIVNIFTRPKDTKKKQGQNFKSSENTTGKSSKNSTGKSYQNSTSKSC